jgi:integrase/recombinase XerD
LRFFFATTCGKPEMVKQVPYGKRPKTLPIVLAPAATHRFLDAFGHPPTRMLFRTIYACGLRLSEALHLRVSDIDSSRLLVHIRHGKGAKDRCVPLSARLLQELRAYWRRYRPADLLFPGQTASGALCAGSLQRHCVKARRRAGLQVRVTPHTLRHCYATHLLEAGVDVPTLQRLLGHSNLQTTAHYLHIRSDRVTSPSSPYDLLTIPNEPSPHASRATANPADAAPDAGRAGAALRPGVCAAAPVAD